MCACAHVAIELMSHTVTDVQMSRMSRSVWILQRPSLRSLEALTMYSVYDVMGLKMKSLTSLYS